MHCSPCLSGYSDYNTDTGVAYYNSAVVTHMTQKFDSGKI